MRTLRNLGIAFAALVAIPLVAALFLDNEYAITREITINKPSQEVFGYIRHLKNQDNYSYWVMMDPNMQKTYRGTDGSEGFVYAWDGNDDAGAGEQEIKHIKEGERIELEVRFKRPFEGVAYTPFTTEAVAENQTKVTWGMSGSHAYPFNFMNLFMDKALGKDLEVSLVNLKNLLENKKIKR